MRVLKKILEKPFKLMSVFGIIYIAISILLNIFTGFSYKESLLPFSKLISFVAEGIAFTFCVLVFFFCNRHSFFYAALEFLVFSSVYNGRIYSALFLSSLLFILLLAENKIVSRKNVVVFSVIEIVKIVLVIPYGVTNFFNYVGLTLFSLCTIVCINLLFRHAYTKNDDATINLNDYKFTDRQKNCIEEIVVNNTTIKALAINHNVSESAIKKDLAHIYSVLGITGKADLKALFIGYKF